jgi:dTDP-4-amino-4,6-dideoxygalactose transaminase
LTSLSFLTFKLPKLRKWKYVKKLENKFLEFLDIKKTSKILSFYNWRTAIFQALKLIWIEEQDEIIINGYNCISVINSVIQAKGNPIYVDIDKTNLSFDLGILESKITDKTKVIIVQHTFWKTAPIKEILKLSQKYNIPLIEDCAHSLGSKFYSKMHGTFWDFAIFSTWRDKVISWVNWWFLIINNKKYFDKYEINEIEKNLQEVPKILVVRNLFYNVFWYLAYKTYSLFWIWKFIIFISRKLHLINEILDKEEKRCENDKLYYKLPNSLAKLALDDFQEIENYTKKRRKIAEYYDENIKFKHFKKAFEENENEKLNYFRYPIIFKNSKEMYEFYSYMRKNKVLVWVTWSKVNIVPKGIVLAKTKYKWDCDNSEKLSSKLVFLPNTKFMTKDDVKRVVKLCNEFKNLNVI